MGSKPKDCCTQGFEDEPINFKVSKKRLNSHMFERANLVEAPKVTDFIDFNRYFPKLKHAMDNY